MTDSVLGTVLSGDPDVLKASCDEWQSIPVDCAVPHGPEDDFMPNETTLNAPFSVTGPGTFFGKAQRTLHFEPSVERGWRFDRTDLPDSLPIQVAVDTIWTTTRNIVLCSGSPHNYMRMVEHIVALRTGLGLDNVTIRMDSGDPPLFDQGSLDLVEGVARAGLADTGRPATVVAVKEPVTIMGNHGSFLQLRPPEAGSRRLEVDCAINFKSAIGKQRIQFTNGRRVFTEASQARTNAPLWIMLYYKTAGLLFADIRHLGYTTRNILIHGRWRYLNRPRMLHNGRALEPVWHRACMDLLAAVALVDRGRLAGRLISYKAGHALDCQLMRELYQRDLLEVI